MVDCVLFPLAEASTFLVSFSALWGSYVIRGKKDSGTTRNQTKDNH